MALVLLVAVCALGCASATKRFEQGAELEAKGRRAEAAQRYIQALRKDPGLPEARQRLEALGPKLIEEYLEQARSYASSGFQVRRADAYRSIDALVTDAATVGVPLALAPDYAEDRRSAFDAAIAQLLQGGRQSETEAHWADAVRAYEQVALYAPATAQSESARLAQGRTWVLWGESELAAGRCRAAFERAERAVAVLGGPERAGSERAVRLREQALARGTVQVAVAPVREATGALPDDFVSALNDELELRHWSQPPAFVAVIDPVRVRRELRDQGLAHALLTEREAARVGRVLGADFTVSGEITELVEREYDVREEKRPARTRAGQDTTYVVRKGKHLYELHATYALVEVPRSRQAARRTFEVSESEEFHHGVYAGDPGELQLSASERRLFERRRRDEELHQVESRLIAKATERLAQQVFTDILSHVP